jgi:hypothetical protein
MERDRTHEKRIVGRTTRGPMPTRYDLVLAVVPLAFAVALVAGLLSPVSVHAALAAAGVVGVAAVVDALFVNPPERGDRPGGRRRRAD